MSFQKKGLEALHHNQVVHEERGPPSGSEFHKESVSWSLSHGRMGIVFHQVAVAPVKSGRHGHMETPSLTCFHIDVCIKL